MTVRPSDERRKPSAHGATSQINPDANDYDMEPYGKVLVTKTVTVEEVENRSMESV